ncbi:MAG: CoA-acylating methylmalonate-semialdehyde dehydrogenase [Planctomycetota bacterium]|nr:CoA-acylating methylmalonate-semialdehyde dehydrogenase [Planctomycetota bacterium]
MTSTARLKNFIGGVWCEPAGAEYLPVVNPATASPLAYVPQSDAAAVGSAVEVASRVYRNWRRIPPNDRAQFLYRFKTLLEAHQTELARTITDECGKTLAEASAEVRRGIENVEVACGIPTYLQGWNNEDISPGVDEHLFRQPLGVVAAITPFNFPAMIPLWFLPYAIACGNCFILKPSEKVPRTSVRLFELLEQTGLPAGVAQLVHGGRPAVDSLIEHPGISAISFVGSTSAARQVYGRAAANGKRVQCQGGAKNPVVILPDADMELTTQIVADSAFGCAGQRCLAASTAIAVGTAGDRFCAAISEAASSRRVGYGADPGVQMGPVISSESRERVERLIGSGCVGGGRILVDGRGKTVDGFEDGFFLFPTILDEVSPTSELARTEVFGPVLSLIRATDLDEAIAMINCAEYGNMASIFTTSGGAARKFRYEVEAGNIGINIGVAAPMAYFPFSGAKASFLGDLHAQGRHGVEFYTQTKVVVERWP